MTSILVEEGRLAARSVGAEVTGMEIESQCEFRIKNQHLTVYSLC